MGNDYRGYARNRCLVKVCEEHDNLQAIITDCAVWLPAPVHNKTDTDGGGTSLLPASVTED